MSRALNLLTAAAGLVCLAPLSSVALAQDSEEATGAGPRAEITFGTDVDRETRTVTGEAVVFGTDLERVWCLTRIIGLEPPATVTHAWYYEGKTMARVDLKVGSPDWRTWSSKRFLPEWTGRWEVKVLDEAGKFAADVVAPSNVPGDEQGCSVDGNTVRVPVSW